MKSSNTVLQPFNHCIFDTPGMHLFCTDIVKTQFRPWSIIYSRVPAFYPIFVLSGKIKVSFQLEHPLYIIQLLFSMSQAWNGVSALSHEW